MDLKIFCKILHLFIQIIQSIIFKILKEKGRYAMKYGKRWSISNDKKKEYISRLLPQLSALRARAGLSQDELAGLVGISRQTYCLTESGSRGMSWNTYLSIMMFFDYNVRTHDLIRSTGIFPEDLFYQFNPGENRVPENSFGDNPELDSMFTQLDDYGKNAVKAAIASEFSRCKTLDKAETISLMSELISDAVNK